VKYFFLSLIFILASCSLNKNSSYWNEDQIKNSVDSKRPNKISSKTVNFKIMTFDEFNIFLKDYSDNAEYPDINN
tara:strand:- start:279 stop:503 length:225 start_codon:yes stop_codon:yes gene_type:complete